MKIILSIVLTIIFTSCQTTDENEISLDTLSKPSSKYKYEEKSKVIDSKKELAYDTLSYFSKKIIDTLGISETDVYAINQLLFPDRFNPVKSEKWYGVNEQDSFVYKHWKYVDTNVAENTFYNWLDNFGDKHLSLRFGDKVRVSPNAFVLLLQHRSILFVETKKRLEKEKIINLLDTLGFGNTWKFVLFQNKGEKTAWFEQFNINSKNENRKP